MKVLYFDCFSGAAGDMILGALLDTGADESFVRTQLEGLHLEGWSLELQTVTRSGIRATHALVQISDDQPARDYPVIRDMLAAADLDANVRNIAAGVFRRLAEAEAHVHGVDLEQVHLHEVAAVDAFIDIVGAAAALVSLSPDRIVASTLPVGGGTTRSAHGELPVPPPAVVELLKGVPVRGGGDRELLTPTGAAILTGIVDGFGDVPAMRIERAGYGAGSKDAALPNVVRVLFGESLTTQRGAEALLLETNLDDMSPELIPPVLERLLAAGAYDAWVTPIVMKKGRPAVTLSALIPPHERDRALDVLYRETTTLGVRLSIVHKDELERSWIEVMVEGMPVRVKQGGRGGSVTNRSPEYEDALTVARATGLPLKEVYRLALLAAGERSSG